MLRRLLIIMKLLLVWLLLGAEECGVFEMLNASARN
jgi:hypothetical protein